MARVYLGKQALDLDTGRPLNIVLGEAGAPVESPCGGRGRCGRCLVRLSGTVPPPVQADLSLLSREEIEAGFRLACQHYASDGLRVEVYPQGIMQKPGVTEDVATARKAGLSAALTPEAMTAAFYHSPLVTRSLISLPTDFRGSVEAGGSLWEKLRGLLPEGTRLTPPSIHVLRDLGVIAASNQQTLSAITSGDRLLALHADQDFRGIYGAALDIGTTSLAVSLVDLDTGAVIGTASALNPQTAYGGDIMSRLGHAIRGEGLQELRSSVLRGLNSVLEEACGRADISPGDIWGVAVVGNTAMHHLFLGLDVQHLALSPYMPVILEPLLVTAADTGLDVRPEGMVYCLPNLGGFVGADLAGVLLATRLWETDAPRLVLDLGTNGEILLGHRGKVWACSTAAGPAFEGGAISCGMRAVSGAIQAVSINGGDIRLDVIGGGSPVGVCGSGLIDAVAELLSSGILDRDGRLHGAEFALAEGVILTQKDIRQLQLAKGAIRAGVEVLLKIAGLEPEDLEEVILAGTFGNYVDERKAVQIGLLPPVAPEKVRPIGNAALDGARMALLSAGARRALEDAAKSVEHISLALRADFQEIFMERVNF